MSSRKIILLALLIGVPLPFTSWAAHALCARVVQDTMQCMASAPGGLRDHAAVKGCLDSLEPSSAWFTLLRVLLMNGIGLPLILIGQRLLDRLSRNGHARLPQNRN